MAIVNVSRWKANLEQVAPLARQAGAIIKRHGATSVRFGPCYAGADAGMLYVAVTYPDWAGFARTQQALAADPEFQRLYGEAQKIGALQDRSLIVAEDV
jgi:hypothetical protein